ncbi:hypothetical protein [Streptomyces pakalii]|uniref:Uncharacterized protein n=1 Tax=Streptomyces pakalii TaxID=3036494 RepID=A0ABT7DCQ7_9ACTN|nr:hypothetical protein [Streptomyces pakalii]MDJ1642737.1 hypothetical protein [Streptomyces pakalii]
MSSERHEPFPVQTCPHQPAVVQADEARDKTTAPEAPEGRDDEPQAGTERDEDMPVAPKLAGHPGELTDRFGHASTHLFGSGASLPL